jgi:AcrR family transcriptional regulator
MVIAMSESRNSGSTARPRKQPRAREEKSAARRDAILAAALDEFAASGFAATRIDDVARRAGVAKGTIYLYFRDKEALFQELVRSALSPIVAVLEHPPAGEVTLRGLIGVLVQTFVREIYGTRRKDVIRLVLSEGPRFPNVAEFYYREVVGRALPAVRELLRRAVEPGNRAGEALVEYPQLIVAPALVAVMWEALFGRFEPLDAEGLMRAHGELLLGALERREP